MGSLSRWLRRLVRALTVPEWARGDAYGAYRDTPWYLHDSPALGIAGGVLIGLVLLWLIGQFQ